MVTCAPSGNVAEAATSSNSNRFISLIAKEGAVAPKSRYHVNRYRLDRYYLKRYFQPSWVTVTVVIPTNGPYSIGRSSKQRYFGTLLRTCDSETLRSSGKRMERLRTTIA